MKKSLKNFICVTTPILGFCAIAPAIALTTSCSSSEPTHTYLYAIDTPYYKDGANDVHYTATQYKDGLVNDIVYGNQALTQDLISVNVTFADGQTNTFTVNWVYTSPDTLGHKTLDPKLMYFQADYDAIYYQFGTEKDPVEDYTIYNGDTGVILEYNYEDTTHIEENFYWDSYNDAVNGYTDVSQFISQTYQVQISPDQYNLLLDGDSITIVDGTGYVKKMDINMYVLDNALAIHNQYVYLNSGSLQLQ